MRATNGMPTATIYPEFHDMFDEPYQFKKYGICRQVAHDDKKNGIVQSP